MVLPHREEPTPCRRPPNRRWRAIDVLGIGYYDTCDAPVVMFVSVEPGSLFLRDGRDVATLGRLLLAYHELHDVHCEIKESCLLNLAALGGLQLPSNAGTTLYAEDRVFTGTCLGNVEQQQGFLANPYP